MDRFCYFCTEEVGSGHPIGDGPASACGRCVHEILVRAAADEPRRRRQREAADRVLRSAAADVFLHGHVTAEHRHPGDIGTHTHNVQHSHLHAGPHEHEAQGEEPVWEGYERGVETVVRVAEIDGQRMLVRETTSPQIAWPGRTDVPEDVVARARGRYAEGEFHDGP